ncbi:MAG: hypothetical protein HQ481_06095 [Alphaproteobacteria bacterium]|nr:hypothetical protein [Alphaproteobacteria bacterium]
MAFRHYRASGTGPTLLTLSSGSIYQGAEVVASQSHTIVGRSVVVSTDWQVSASPSFSTVVWQSLGQVADPFTATVPASTLAIATAYYARWRANYADASTSPWAPAIGFATSAVTPLTVNTIMVAGGGNGGSNIGGGGGGGEVYHASLVLTTNDTFVVTSVGGPGQNTVANGITVIAGGVGGTGSGGGGNGGSGGGGAGDNDGSGGPAGSKTGSYLGNNGYSAVGINWVGGGGGGAGAAAPGRNGGAGHTWIDGLDYGSGGGAGARTEAGSAGNAGGPGAGAGVMGNGVYGPGQSATARGGGGGGGPNYGGSNGGGGAAGCVVLAYSGTTVKASGGAITTDGVFTYHTFAGAGTFSVL